MRLWLSIVDSAVEHCRPRARHTASQLSPPVPRNQFGATVAVADDEIPDVCDSVGVILIVMGVGGIERVTEGVNVAVTVQVTVEVAVGEGLAPKEMLRDGV